MNHHYGPETDDSVGIYREFTLDDFEDVKDNITFSSKHIGCALIELESRYAPLLPEDRKTELVFTIKDFLFSSKWKYSNKLTVKDSLFTSLSSISFIISHSYSADWIYLFNGFITFFIKIIQYLNRINFIIIKVQTF